MSTERLLLLTVAVGLGVALILAVGWWRAATRTRRSNRVRGERARQGELDAEDLLDELGFHVVERQAHRTWTIWVDEEPRDASVRADLLVERDGALFVAEVKTGQRALDPRHPSTRRQLLEYWLVFQPDGLLVVDMESRRVREITFDFALGP
jgi:hypothetical protein